MQPLANKIRPTSLEEYIGQKHLVGAGKPLRVAIENGHIFSFILWGMPGIGKTTLARIYANAINVDLHELSAVFAGKEDIRKIVKTSAGLHLSFFDAFMGELETELSLRANHQIGRTHGIQDTERYDARMEAVNFSLSHDDGVSDKDLQKADVILVGVSRSGKTPTCLYLALQYGIRAANYPLTPDDLDSTNLPRMLKPFKHKIYGLTIEPQRLHHIRSERRPDSRYASIENCRFEVNEAESMFRQHNIPFTNTTHKSIEELAASILIATKLQRRF